MWNSCLDGWNLCANIQIFIIALYYHYMHAVHYKLVIYAYMYNVYIPPIHSDNEFFYRWCSYHVVVYYKL